MTEKVNRRNGRWRETEDKRMFPLSSRPPGEYLANAGKSDSGQKQDVGVYGSHVENSFIGQFFHFLLQPGLST